MLDPTGPTPETQQAQRLGPKQRFGIKTLRGAQWIPTPLPSARSRFSADRSVLEPAGAAEPISSRLGPVDLGLASRENGGTLTRELLVGEFRV